MPAASRPLARDGWCFSNCGTKTCGVRSTPWISGEASWHSLLELILGLSRFASVPLPVAGEVTSRRTSTLPRVLA